MPSPTPQLRSQTIRDDPAPDILGESTNLRLVRLRLFLALITMFLVPIAIAAPVVYGLAVGFGASMVVPTVGLLVLGPTGRRPIRSTWRS